MIVSALPNGVSTPASTSKLGLVKVDGTTVTIDSDGTIHSSGGGGLYLDDVSGATATPNKNAVTLIWTDPDDIVVSGQTLSQWAGTKVVRKVGSAPSSQTDGTVVVDSKVRDQYSEDGFVDTGLTYGETYYYRFFPYNTTSLYTSGTSVTVTPERETISYPTAGSQLTYTGAEQTQSFNNYSSTTMTVTGNTGTNAGSYTASFVPKSDYQWSDGTQDAYTVSWTIAKQTLVDPTLNSSVTITYDGTEKNAATLGAFTGYDSSTMTVTGNTRTNAGSQTATFGLVDSDNYQWSDSAPTIVWSIAKASFTSSVTMSGYTYAGTKSTPSVTSNPGNASVTYYGRATSSGSGTEWSNVTATTYDAGTRYIYAVIAESDNYLGCTTDNTSFTIAKASFTATVSIDGYTYGGTKSTPTISSNPGSGTVTYYGRATSSGTATAWSSVTSTTYDAGTRYVYAVIAETTNYNSYTTDNTSFTIAKGSFTATVSISGYTYDGTKSSPSVSSNPGSGTVTYYGRATSSGTATEWSNVTSTTYDAGTRYVYAVIAETTNYNSYTTGNTSFTISKAAGWITRSPNSVTLDSTHLSGAIIVAGATGAITITSSDTTIATVSPASMTTSGGTLTIASPNNKKGSATVTLSAAASTNYNAASKTVSVTGDFPSPIYGAEWDGTSTTAWTRTDAAANFTDPVPAVNNGNGSSPFDTISPWKDITSAYNSIAGELVEIPKFYYKLTQTGNAIKIQVSSDEFDGSYVSPAHMDRGDGSGVRDKIYIGRYHCASDYKSKTGVTPLGNITRATARSGIHNLGSTFYQWDFATLFTIWLLYLVEFADWNSQAKIGYGRGDNSTVGNTGYTDSMRYHTGTSALNRTTYGLGTQYRYIEGLWDNVYDWLDGCYNDANGLNLIQNPANFSDSTGGTLIGKPTNGFPSAFTVSSAAGFPVFYPSAKSGSDSTYSCDSWKYSSTDPCITVGGDYGNDQSRGLFFISSNAISTSSATRSCRLMKLP